MNVKWLSILVVALSLGVPSFSLAHASGAPTPAAAIGQEPRWDLPPAEFRDIQRQGFHDGIEGARKDFDNHRRPDVNNREEYRKPHMPESAREDYREGFRRGYEAGVRHLYGADYAVPPR